MRRECAICLSFAVAGFLLIAPKFAQARSTANSPGSTSATAASGSAHSFAATREAMRMVPAEANLVKTLDAREIKAGYQFEAKLTGNVQLKNGPDLPRGTELMGTVVKDQMSADGQTSTLALRFTKAVTKDGKSVPIKATIVAIYPPAVGYGQGQGQDGNYWTDKTLQVDQIGVLAGVDLHSRIAGSNSGVFESKKKDNMKLSSGSEIALAIAERNAGSQASSNVGGGA